MKRSSLVITVLGVTAGLSGLASSAFAQADQTANTIQSSIVEGPGHPVGEGAVVHPHLSLETGVVNNLFYEEDDAVTTMVARIIAGVSIASRNAPKTSGAGPAIVTESDVTTEDGEEEAPPASSVDFRLGAQLMFLGYPTSNDRARDQSDLAGALDGQVIVNPAGDFTFSAADQFLRDAQPRNFESFGSLNRDYNHAALGLMYRPGEHALGFGVRYENTIDRFESDESAFANRIQHLFALRAEWKYLPLTKFYFDASYGIFGRLGDEGMGFKSSSNPIRAELGVGTAITWATSIVAHLGYAHGGYDTGESYDMVTGGLQFGYRYAPYGRVTLTADYDFRDSLQANYYSDITLGANVDQQFGLWLLTAQGVLKLRGYRGIPAVIGPDSRDDVIFGATGQLAYIIRDNFGVAAKVRALIDSTDYMSTSGSPEFTRFEGTVQATVAF
jgi:hypothetical protein